MLRATLRQRTLARGILGGLVVFIAFAALSCAPTGPLETAPDFTLSAAGGDPVTLSEELEAHHAVVLVFYRGFF